MAVWAATEAGYPTTHWYPGALAMLGLLVVAASTLRLPPVPRPVLLAALLLLAFTLWSFASISWADDQGEAWDGANRTLLYLLVFLLFGLWPLADRVAAAIAGVWVGALTAIAVVVVYLVSFGGDPAGLFASDRLNEPAGYVNASSALFLMPAWVALVLASRFELRPLSRGLLAGAVVMLASAAFLGQSRGAVFSLPLVIIFLFAATPGRASLFGVLVPIGAATAACGVTILSALDAFAVTEAAKELDGVAPRVGISALVACLVVFIAASFERRSAPQSRRAVQRWLARAGVATAVAIAVCALWLAGNPFDRADDAWSSFQAGYAEQDDRGRLASGLGSNRHDFYRVALDQFAEHPWTGVGADNFQQDYLVQRRSDETPRYPHSWQMRTLSQTGLVGALLLAGAIAAALLAAARSVRNGPGLAGAVAAGAVASFAYWLVHGSVDWFWEFAGLGAPAFAMLGLACGLCPRKEPKRTGQPRPLVRTIVVALLGLAAATSFALPFIADIETDRAARGWTQSPSAAFDQLQRSAELDRLSDRPYLVGGTIALRLDRLDEAERQFRLALERNSRGAYATLELGAIASNQGRRTEAVNYLRRAVELDPRSTLMRQALRQAKRGKGVNLEALTREFRQEARKLDE
jgi:O-antigen ligase/Tfp pilus assembly protein PilF